MTTIQPISNVKEEENLRSKINQIIRQVSDTTGDISIAVGGNFTLSNPKIYNGSTILIVPTNNAASLARYFVGSVNDKQATITFANISGTSTFRYAIVGSV